MELRVVPARELRTRDAGKRRSLLPVAALALALVPTALGLPPHPEGPSTRAPETLPDPDPTRLALAPRELVAEALRVELEPRFEDLEVAPAPVSSPPPEAPPVLGPNPAAASGVAEPPSIWLSLLSLASAAVASGGRRRSPRPHRHR